MSSAWIGVDLDGTLAEYGGWVGPEHIGAPIPKMVDRVKEWLAAGRTVKIFTARVCPAAEEIGEAAHARKAIAAWTQNVFGQELEVTATKDFSMTQLWDDRAIQIIENTGVRADGRIS